MAKAARQLPQAHSPSRHCHCRLFDGLPYGWLQLCLLKQLACLLRAISLSHCQARSSFLRRGQACQVMPSAIKGICLPSFLLACCTQPPSRHASLFLLLFLLFCSFQVLPAIYSCRNSFPRQSPSSQLAAAAAELLAGALAWQLSFTTCMSASSRPQVSRLFMLPAMPYFLPAFSSAHRVFLQPASCPRHSTEPSLLPAWDERQVTHAEVHFSQLLSFSFSVTSTRLPSLPSLQCHCSCLLFLSQMFSELTVIFSLAIFSSAVTLHMLPCPLLFRCWKEALLFLPAHSSMPTLTSQSFPPASLTSSASPCRLSASQQQGFLQPGLLHLAQVTECFQASRPHS